jgi:hypothetical protein
MGITNAEKKEKQERKAHARKALLKLLKKTHKVYTCLKHVSSSGMTRHISCYVGGKDGIVDITWYVSQLLDYRRNSRDGGLVVGGCGMDMGFAVVYNLGAVLYPHGFKCWGKDCNSNDHLNDYNCKRERGKHLHKSGGYALTHYWI